MTLNHVDRRKDVVIQRTGSTERREKIVLDRVAARRAILYKAVQLVWMLGGILEALLGLRLLLKFIAADPNAAFAQFIYQASALFVAPFNNLTVNPAVNGMVIEL